MAYRRHSDAFALSTRLEKMSSEFNTPGSVRRSQSMETYMVRVFLGPLSNTTEFLSVEALKNTNAEEIVRVATSKLKLGPPDKYELAETFSSGGALCKERRLNGAENPVRIQLLWPRVSQTCDANRTEYHFYLRLKEPDRKAGSWIEFGGVSSPVESFLSKFLQQPSKKEYPDLCNLPNLNETTLLENIKLRFENGSIYTYVGSILISVNPFKFYPIYNPKFVKMYQNRTLGDLPPHIFAIADASYHTMLAERRNQCIVISGESGSGKTESTNLLLHHLSALSQRGVSGDGIEQTILGAGPVLEAFGNAKTVHNNNSSRFGKFIQVNYKENGMVHGAVVEKYLLEKSRIVSQAEDERNYHVFYYLLAGATESEKESLSLLQAKDYHYLNQSKCYEVEGSDNETIDEAHEFTRLRQSMEMVGFSQHIQHRIFCALSAVLHLGNVEYKKKADHQHHEAVSIKDPNTVKIISNLLMVKEATFVEALTKRKTTAGGETVVMNYNMADALSTRDGMAKCLYGGLFDWIVLQINHALLSKRDIRDHQGNSIGVLDIFGFEDFGKNSFEQFCINYANERLHYYFNQHIFKFEQEEYIREGIVWKNIEFIDNTGCLDLFSKKPNGLLYLLDEECNFPGATNDTLLAKFHARHTNNSYYEVPQMKEGAFSIVHYAGKVKYKAQDFRQKNSDLMRHDIVLVLKNSSLAFVRELVGYDPVAVLRWSILRAFFRAYFAFLDAGKQHRKTEATSKYGAILRPQNPNQPKSPNQLASPDTRRPYRRVIIVEKHASLHGDSFDFANGFEDETDDTDASPPGVRHEREAWGSDASFGFGLDSESRVMRRANKLLMKNKSFRPRSRSAKTFRDLKTMKTLAVRTFQPRNSKGKSKPPSVSAQFNYSLSKLMETLRLANPFFIRCIKSNADKAPCKFDEEIVLRQLRYTGMLATVKIRQSGYNYRLTFEEFIQQYKMLLPKGLVSSKDDVSQFLAQLDLNTDNYQIGKTKVFLREGEKLYLDEALHQAIMERIIQLQRWVKTRLERRKFLKLRGSAILIQCNWRGFIARRQVADMQLQVCAAMLIQKIVRGFIARKRYREKCKATLVIQRNIRKHLAIKEVSKLREERRLEEIRKAEEERLRKEEEARMLEEARKREEEERLQEEERLRAEEEARLEEKRKQEEREKEEAQKLEEEQRLLEEQKKEAEKQRRKEERIKAEEERKRKHQEKIDAEIARVKREIHERKEAELKALRAGLWDAQKNSPFQRSPGVRRAAVVSPPKSHSVQGLDSTNHSVYETVDSKGVAGHPPLSPSGEKSDWRAKADRSHKYKVDESRTDGEGVSRTKQLRSPPPAKVHKFSEPVRIDHDICPEFTHFGFYEDSKVPAEKKTDVEDESKVIPRILSGHIDVKRLSSSSISSDKSPRTPPDRSHLYKVDDVSSAETDSSLSKSDEKKQKRAQAEAPRSVYVEMMYPSESRKMYREENIEMPLETVVVPPASPVFTDLCFHASDIDSSKKSSAIDLHSTASDEGILLKSSMDDLVDRDEHMTHRDRDGHESEELLRQSSQTLRTQQGPSDLEIVIRPAVQPISVTAPEITISPKYEASSKVMFKEKKVAVPLARQESINDKHEEGPRIVKRISFDGVGHDSVTQTVSNLSTSSSTSSVSVTTTTITTTSTTSTTDLLGSEAGDLAGASQSLLSPFHRARKKVQNYLGGRKHSKKENGSGDESEEESQIEETISPVNTSIATQRQRKESSDSVSNVTQSKHKHRRKNSRKGHHELEKKADCNTTWSISSTSQWQYPTDILINDANQLQLLSQFVFDKIQEFKKQNATQRDTVFDVVFKDSLDEFHQFLITQTSSAMQEGDVNFRYKDLMCSFEEAMKHRAQNESLDNEALTTMGINAFRGYLNEFDKKKTTMKIIPKHKVESKKDKKKKDKDGVFEHMGHRFQTVQVRIATYCESCSSLMWMVEKCYVCQVCKYTVHKKCYTKSRACKAVYSGKDKKPGDNRVIGVPLVSVLGDNEKIPSVISRLITAIEVNGLYTVGLYRKAGVAGRIKHLVTLMNTDVKSIDFNEYPVHVLTSVMKSFFRELPEPLLTFDLYDDVIRAAECQDEKERVQLLYSVVGKLPNCNYNLLERLIFHLSRVAQHESSNRMSSCSLAIIFAPSILRSNREMPAQLSLLHVPKQTTCIQTLIEEQLKKIRSTLADITTLDTATLSAEDHLNTLRASRRTNGVVERVSEATTPPVMEEVNDPEEKMLSDQIRSLQEERELLTIQMPALECRHSSSEEDILSTDDIESTPGDLDDPTYEEFAVTFDFPAKGRYQMCP